MNILDSNIIILTQVKCKTMVFQMWYDIDRGITEKNKMIRGKI